MAVAEDVGWIFLDVSFLTRQADDSGLLLQESPIVELEGSFLAKSGFVIIEKLQVGRLRAMTLSSDCLH